VVSQRFQFSMVGSELLDDLLQRIGVLRHQALQALCAQPRRNGAWAHVGAGASRCYFQHDLLLCLDALVTALTPFWVLVREEVVFILAWEKR
jgi:hypothetical protein